jgi:uncharacterized membrane protein
MVRFGVNVFLFLAAVVASFTTRAAKLRKYHSVFFTFFRKLVTIMYIKTKKQKSEQNLTETTNFERSGK